MTDRIKITGQKKKRIGVTDKKAPRIDGTELASALGARTERKYEQEINEKFDAWASNYHVSISDVSGECTMRLLALAFKAGYELAKRGKEAG